MDPRFLPMQPTGNTPDDSPANALSQSVADIEPDAAKTAELHPAVMSAIRTVFDPEIPVNIDELGLIYDVLIDKDARVGVRMTLTAPGCPAAQSLPVEVRQKTQAVAGVSEARVEVVWEPTWTPDRMSDAAKLQLGMW